MRGGVSVNVTVFLLSLFVMPPAALSVFRVCADVQHVLMATCVWFMDYEFAAPHVQTSTEIFAQTSNKP